MFVKFKKFVSLLLLLSLTFSGTPSLAIAQEITDTPIEPTAEVTIAPENTPEPTVAPTEIPVIVTDTPTPEPTAEPTLEPTPIEVTPTDIPTPTEEAPTAQAPPQQDETLTAVILENTSADSALDVILEDLEPAPSATLVTDKADYAPTDSVLITGSNFAPNASYTIYITSETGGYSFSDTVIADDQGNIVYTHQLDGTYRPEYKVEVKQGDTVLASTTFTDADTTFKSPSSTGNPNKWSNGDRAYSSNNSSANTNRDDNDQGYRNFGFSIPTDSTINGIEVKLEARQEGTTCELQARLSGDNGSNRTGRKTLVPTGSDSILTYGGSSDLWGDSWSSGEFSNSNFVLEVLYNDPGDGCDTNGDTRDDIYLDHAQVKVYYTEATPQPDLTVAKTNNTSNNGETGTSFNWIFTITNSGNATASFSNSMNVLKDELPTTGAIYGSPSVSLGSGVTGVISCSVTDNVLNCTSGGGTDALSMPAGKTITVTLPVTPTAVGTLTNPRNSGICTVDFNSDMAEKNEANNDCNSNSVSVVQGPVANPPLPQSCGLDIAFVIDNSGSISNSELTQMKNAFNGFVTALSGTPTQYSVTRFNTSASVVQAFTSDTAAVQSAINSISTSGGWTNWEDGLKKAQSTLPNRTNPDLVLFASDGDPTTSNGPLSDLQDAVVVADALKTSGTRIVAFGIGNGLLVNNLKAISGPTVGTDLSADVITSDFGDLAADLAAYASSLCGGTITIHKLIDVDGNYHTENDQTNGSNWSFSASVHDGTSTPVSGLTDNGGLINFDINIDTGEPYATVDITETLQTGYDLIYRECRDQAGNPLGGSITNGFGNIQVGQSDIITCKFINYQRPQTGSITIIKDAVPNDPQDFHFMDYNNRLSDFYLDDDDDPTLSDTITFNNLPEDLYEIRELRQSGWVQSQPVCTGASDIDYQNATGENPGWTASIHLIPGENVTCTFTNTKLGSISGHKIWDKNDNRIYDGDDEYVSNWSVFIDGNDNQSYDSGETIVQTDGSGLYTFSNLALGSHTFCEIMQPHWVAGSHAATCYSVNLTSQNPDASGYNFYNYQVGYLKIAKDLVPDSSVWYDLGYDNSSITGNNQDFTSDWITVPTGEHTVWEKEYNGSDLSGFQKTYSGDCDNQGLLTIGQGEHKTCTITNTQYGSIQGTKVNDLDGDGDILELEPTLNGWTIFIDENGNGSLDSGERSTVTATNTQNNIGEYLFENLLPDTYSVCEVEQTGWKRTVPAGSNCQNATVTAGQTTYDIRFGNTRNPVKLLAHKVVCDTEADLPDWGNRGGTIGATTAQDWVNQSHGHCRLEDQWTFQWAPAGSGSTGDFAVNTSSLGAPWTTFTVGETVEFNDTSNLGGRIEVREIIPENYSPLIGFSGEPGSVGQSTSAEIYCTGDVYNYDNWEWINSPQYGSTYYCVAFNALNYGSISGIKFIDNNADGQYLSADGDTLYQGWTIKLSKHDGTNYQFLSQTTTDSDGKYLFDNLQAGMYLIEEAMDPNYKVTDPNQFGLYNGVLLNAGQDLTGFTFGNAPLSDIHGFKWNDLNGNGIYDCSQTYVLDQNEFEQICEPKMAGWTIFLDDNRDGLLTEGEKFMVTSDLPDPDHNGWYWFEDLLPGNYRICELAQDGWMQTSTPTCHEVTLPYTPGFLSTRNISANMVVAPDGLNFGNVFVNPRLTISKSNDAVGDKRTGESVVYTLTVKVLDGLLKGVYLVDLLPSGFTYRSGSWTASKNGLAYSIPEPVYASPGTWNLGDLAKDDEVILTYTADINGAVLPGIYKDVAWASGEDVLAGLHLAEAIDPGYLSTNFVGTSVKIVGGNSISGGYQGQSETKVLGASTELPLTGTPTFSTIFAAFLIIAGFATVIYSRKTKKHVQ